MHPTVGSMVRFMVRRERDGGFNAASRAILDVMATLRTGDVAASVNRNVMAGWINDALARQPIVDLHTHCYAPGFGCSPEPDGLLLWGIDELVTYHYLVAEVFRVVPAAGRSGPTMPYEAFWRLSKAQQADHIWQHLFIEHTPISEACRGVLTALGKLGLDPNERTLEPYRRWFADQDPNHYVDRVMQIANVESITMTNPVFDDHERQVWLDKPAVGDDPRFEAVLRLDPLLRDWPGAAARLTEWGYDVREDRGGGTRDEVRRFLVDWIERMRAIYLAVSLPPDFCYPDAKNPAGDWFLDECLLPVCAERGLPFAMMIGSQRLVNRSLQDAGDMTGKADIRSVVNLCAAFADNKFLVTMLARENQHELCVAARKFGNLMIFGCWWFVNNPSIVEEITRERFELLGTSFIPQHSDARILDQLLYKWEHSCGTIGRVMTDKFCDLAETGLDITREQIDRDVALLMRDNFRAFLQR